MTRSQLGLPRQGLRPARLPAGHPPVLLVVVDTEEEFEWSRPMSSENTSVTAIQGLPALQSLFESLGVHPTYVIDYPVAVTASSATILRDFSQRGVAEIGAHLHPWVTPPLEEEVSRFNSYAGNLPAALEAAKLRNLAAAIETGIGKRPLTFKAGRYGIAPRTVDALRALGFRCDLSSSPDFDWRGDGGPDFRGYDNAPYWLPGEPPLLEIPTTGGYYGPLHRLGPRFGATYNGGSRAALFGRLLSGSGLARQAMLTPEGFSLPTLQALAKDLFARGHRVLTISFHSPSSAPGHTPFVRDATQLQQFAEVLAELIRWLQRRHGFVGLTASGLREVLEQR